MVMKGFQCARFASKKKKIITATIEQQKKEHIE
jgi:hypothetical protein